MKEAELRTSEVTMVLNIKQEIVFCSEDSLEILGYLPEELVGKPVTVLMNPRQGRVHQAHIDNFVDKGRYRADIGKFNAIKKDGSTVEVYVWVNSKKPFYINDEPFIPGVIWDAEIVDKYNKTEKEQKRMMQRIEELAETWIREMVNIKSMLGIKINPLMSDEQKNMSIQIINEGGKASQDTNIDGDFEGDITGGNKSTRK